MLQRFFYFISLLFVSVVFRKILLFLFVMEKMGFCDTLGKIVVKPYLDTIHDVRYDYFFFKMLRFS